MFNDCQEETGVDTKEGGQTEMGGPGSIIKWSKAKKKNRPAQGRFRIQQGTVSCA